MKLRGTRAEDSERWIVLNTTRGGWGSSPAAAQQLNQRYAVSPRRPPCRRERRARLARLPLPELFTILCWGTAQPVPCLFFCFHVCRSEVCGRRGSSMVYFRAPRHSFISCFGLLWRCAHRSERLVLPSWGRVVWRSTKLALPSTTPAAVHDTDNTCKIGWWKSTALVDSLRVPWRHAYRVSPDWESPEEVLVLVVWGYFGSRCQRRSLVSVCLRTVGSAASLAVGACLSGGQRRRGDAWAGEKACVCVCVRFWGVSRGARCRR